jgi:hypothetical protein
MFMPELNRNELRQGDIIYGLYYPSMKCETLGLVGRVASPSTPVTESLSLSAVTEKSYGIEWMSAQVQVFRGFSIILSQCCDLERRNGKLNYPAFVISPLQDIPYPIRTYPERLVDFQENSLGKYINNFYILQSPPLPQAYQVDFSMVVSVPRSEFDFALTGKVLQMTDEARVRFKLKLGQHFSRPTQDEIDTGLYPSGAEGVESPT